MHTAHGLSYLNNAISSIASGISSNFSGLPSPSTG